MYINGTSRRLRKSKALINHFGNIGCSGVPIRLFAITINLPQCHACIYNSRNVRIFNSNDSCNRARKHTQDPINREELTKCPDITPVRENLMGNALWCKPFNGHL